MEHRRRVRSVDGRLIHTFKAQGFTFSIELGSESLKPALMGFGCLWFYVA